MGDILRYVQRSGDDEPSQSEVRSTIKFAPEVRLQANMWKESGLLLLPPDMSRRAARTWERRLLLCLLLDEENEELPAELARRASRLFAPGWEAAEGGLAGRRLAALLGCDVDGAAVLVAVARGWKKLRAVA